MKVLFLDTHSKKVTIIIKDGSSLYKEEVESDRSHSEVVMPSLEKILNSAKMELENIEEIIVVNGPGSFTGVRIGVTIAKGIAYSLNIPIKTITSLEMYGVSSNEDFDLVSVADSKGMYSAKFKNNKFENFIYQKKNEFEVMVERENLKVLSNRIIDIDRIIDYLRDKEAMNPHLVNPIYIKEIEVLK